MSAQAAQFALSTSSNRYRLVEFLYEEFHAAGLAAVACLANGEAAGFACAMKTAIRIIATLVECLSYEQNPALSAYLKSVFDYVITHLVIGQGARDRATVERAIATMDDLQRVFLAAHRANP
jgi:flagellar biosynthetic protein FliS